MFITIPESKTVAVTDAGQVFELDDPELANEGPRVTGQELQFVRDFVIRMLLNDPTWGATLEKLYVAMELRGLFKNAKPGDVVELTKDQHTALLEVMRKPTASYVPAVAVHLVEFFRAIEKATAERPAVLQ